MPYDNVGKDGEKFYLKPEFYFNPDLMSPSPLCEQPIKPGYNYMGDSIPDSGNLFSKNELPTSGMPVAGSEINDPIPPKRSLLEIIPAMPVNRISPPRLYPRPVYRGFGDHM